MRPTKGWRTVSYLNLEERKSEDITDLKFCMIFQESVNLALKVLQHMRWENLWAPADLEKFSPPDEKRTTCR